MLDNANQVLEVEKDKPWLQRKKSDASSSCLLQLVVLSISSLLPYFLS
jgi:hypothetical protein